MGRIFLSLLTDEAALPGSLGNIKAQLWAEYRAVVSTPSFLQVEVAFWEPWSFYPGSQLWLWVPFILTLRSFQPGPECPRYCHFIEFFKCIWSRTTMLRKGLSSQLHPPCPIYQKSDIMGQKRNFQLIKQLSSLQKPKDAVKITAVHAPTWKLLCSPGPRGFSTLGPAKALKQPATALHLYLTDISRAQNFLKQVCF